MGQPLFRIHPSYCLVPLVHHFPLFCHKPAIGFGNARHASRNTSCDKHSTLVQQLETYSMAYIQITFDLICLYVRFPAYKIFSL